jgi:hypothetical protein
MARGGPADEPKSAGYPTQGSRLKTHLTGPQRSVGRPDDFRCHTLLCRWYVRCGRPVGRPLVVKFALRRLFACVTAHLHVPRLLHDLVQVVARRILQRREPAASRDLQAVRSLCDFMDKCDQRISVEGFLDNFETSNILRLNMTQRCIPGHHDCGRVAAESLPQASDDN